MEIKVGDTSVAGYQEVYTGSWSVYSTFTADLTTTEASGNVTLNVTGNANTYAGNYVYVRFYNGSGSSLPTVTLDPNATLPPAPSENPDGLLPYQDESLSFEERAADLVSRMTLEEKVAQLGYTAPAIPRLGVKEYNYWRECLHGVARQGQATNFPTPLSLSNTWNRELVYDVADITSTEARAKNNRYNLSYYTPTINMARDPRWGRNEETYGEDPYLTGQLGGEFVKGMQGDDEKYIKIIATIKHFAANNNETNRRGGSSVMSEFNFRNYYLKVFQNVAEIEMPGSVMSSYNATTIYRNGSLLYNYIPSAANTYLLTDILRRTWGFDGYVTTDCGAGEDMISNTSYMNGILGSTTAASGAYIAAALKAGMDVECNLGGGNASTANGADAVLEGYITEEELETNIYHLFLQRFRTGEFDETSSYRDITSAAIETDENVAVAEQAAEESWVLLKNDDNILPIKNAANVAVVGNMANTLALGDYAGSPTKTVKPIEGIRAELEGQGTEVSYLGEITDDEKLFNVKSITFVMKDGSKKAVDISAAESVSGMTLSGGSLIDITPKATAVIKNVSFLNVASVEVEMATGSRIGGSLNIAYGQGGPTVAAINTTATADTDTYVVCTGDYTGEDGGYNGTADMYISASAAVQDFSVANYKTQLDAADVIIAYAGTVPKQDGFGDQDASESKDRTSIDLPAHQAHVQAICNAYPEKTVVVMSTVGQINVEPFMNSCKAILWTSYNGQTQGTALGKVLTGEVNPSGRLSTTWYKSADVSKMELSNNTTQTVGKISGKYTNYDIQADGTNPGHTYQYYSNTPVYPFGYGLSYTSFEYSNMTIDNTSVDANGKVTMTVDVTNTGSAAGKEVVQLYVAHPQDGVSTTPKKQLKGFEKVELAAGETTTVTFELDVDDMALYSETAVKNVVPTGTYTAYIGKNADDISLSKTFDVTGTLDASLETVKAMPDGVSLNAYISEDRTKLSPITQINSNVSAVMYDESVYDLSNAEVKYESSNEAVAVVDADGIVTSGCYDGVATITVSVTIDGVTETDSFPVVNKLQIANDDIPYVIEKAMSKDNSLVDVTLSYRGSVAATDVTLKAEVLNADETVKSTATAAVKGAGKYEINTGALDGETVRYTVVDGDGVNRSDSFTAVYNTPVPSKIVAYYLDSTDYDYTVLTGGTDKEAYAATVNGLSGYGSWTNSTASKADYTYVDINDNEYNYSFTHSWAAGSGSTTNRCLYFTPIAPCKVTAVFYGSEAARSMTIKQGSKQVVQEGVGAAVDVSLEVTDTTTPVYVYGGSSTKYLYAIIVEYYGLGGQEETTPAPTEKATPAPGSEITDTYKIQAGEYKAGDTLYDGEFKLRVTNDITASANTTEGFTAGLTFRTQLGSDIKENVSDIVSYFADAGLNGTTACTSFIFTPKHDGTASIYINGISGDRSLNIWDNTANEAVTVPVSNSVFPAEFTVKAEHEYIVYGRKWTSTALGVSLTYATEEENPPATTPPTEPEPPTTTLPIVPDPSETRVTVTYNADSRVLSLKASAPELIKAAVVKASYDNGVLTGVQIYDPEFGLGTREAGISDFELAPGDKVFVWDSVETMRQYSDVFELAADEAGVAAEDEELEIQTVSWEGDNNIVLTGN
ncbi:MAG: beta-glucosidase, partial [Candidatus Ornithomonoglobus sp.]